ATPKSPATSFTFGEPLIDGNAKNFASVPTFAGSLSPVIVVATKLASKTSAEEGFDLNTLSTDAVNGVFSALDGEPISAGLPQTCLSVFRAVVTDGSVHGIW